MSLSQKGHKGFSQPNAMKIAVSDLKTSNTTKYDYIN
jgi:hypothetical protein